MKKNKYFDYAAIFSIIFLCIGFTIKVLPNDIFYTIKIGDLILKNGIDMQDHFSWLNLPYTYPHWLYDVFMSILYKIKGFNAIYIFDMICFSIIGLLIYFISKKKTKNYLFSFLITIFSIGFLSPFISARAQVISYIIFILEKYFLDKYLNNGKLKNVFILILLSILLVNVHLGTWIFFFILFLPPIVSHYITLFIKKIKKLDNDESFTIGKISFSTNENTPKLFIVILLILFTGLLTPLRFTPYTYIFKQLNSEALGIIQEYNNISISSCFPFFQVLFILTFLFMLTKNKIKLEDLFLTLGLILMSLVSIRSYAYLLILIFYVISNYISTIKLSTKTINQIDYIFSKKIELITITTCFFIASAFLFFINSSPNYYDKSLYPIEAVKFIKNNISLEDARLFNEYEIGSYLLFNDIKVFVDSRQDLYSIPFNKRSRDIVVDFTKANDPFKYEEILNYYEITHVLIYKNETLDLCLQTNDNFEEMYSDNYFILYKRIS